jgi:hypothetical protein
VEGCFRFKASNRFRSNQFERSIPSHQSSGLIPNRFDGPINTSFWLLAVVRRRIAIIGPSIKYQDLAFSVSGIESIALSLRWNSRNLSSPASNAVEPSTSESESVGGSTAIGMGRKTSSSPYQPPMRDSPKPKTLAVPRIATSSSGETQSLSMIVIFDA